MNIERYRDRLRASVRTEQPGWYRIRNAVEPGTTVIDLYDEIDPYWGISASDFVADLRKVEANTIQLHINSPGGNVHDGIAIMNALRQHDARVVTTVDGIAASAAGFIAVGGSDELIMAENSELMAHEAWGLCIGNADDMAKMQGELDRISANIASIYAQKAGGTVAQWRSVMAAETWYSAQEAVDAGLADSVLKSPKKDKIEAKSHFDLSIYNFAGRENAPAPQKPPAERQVSQPRKERPMANLNEGLRELLGVKAEATDDDLLSKVKEVVAERDEALDEATKPPAADANASITPSALPEGIVAIDKTVLDGLQAAARDVAHMREARATEERALLLDDAVRKGKIPPAARASYDAILQTDPVNGAALLASLAPGMVPVAGTEIGHPGMPDPNAHQDAELGSVFAQITGTMWKE